MSNYTLEIQNGKYQGRRVKLTDAESLVGRDEGAKIRINSSEVSRRHCSLTIQEGSVLVTDLNSANGTFINGSPIEQPMLLSPGDTLTVGPMQMKLLGDPKSPAAAPRKKKPGESLSDNDIAAWLSSDALPLTGDTSVTKLPPATGGLDPVPHAQSAAATAPATGEASRRRYRSIAEEAQDIIKRHMALQARQ